MLMFAIAAALALVALVSTFVKKNQVDPSTRPEHIRHREQVAWETALAAETSPLMRHALNLSKPFGSTKQVIAANESPTYQALREKLASTGLYGGSVEVFLSVQMLTLVVGATVLVITAVASPDTMTTLIGALFGVALPLLPFNKVWTTAKKRAELIGRSLPEFAELLQMPLASGMSVIQSLSFTANFIEGPVADEVHWLIDSITKRTMAEEAAFKEAGTRLGTPEAVAFFNALGQAHLKGTKVAENLARQAESLRVKSFQEARSRAKKIPNKVSVMLVLHFLPMLFVLTFIPLIVSLSQT